MTGFALQALLVTHVGISLIAIVTGLVALPALAAHRWLGGWHTTFLATTIATSVTGFLFPFNGVTPAIVVGIISMIVLGIAVFAYVRRPVSSWAPSTYAISGMIALYLNMFVLVAQLFMKVPALKALAPTGSEPPFLIAQTLLLTTSVALGYLAVVGGRSILKPAGTA